jgi:uncharacterized SAM-binding protein YcdF (DUF218 family)
MSYTQPLLALFLGIALAGVIRQKQRGGFWLVRLGVVGLALASWPPADWLFSRPLQVWYPVPRFEVDPPQAIVVLSAAVQPPRPERPYPLANDETQSRCAFAAWLQHRWQKLPVLACGGAMNPGEPPYSATMRQLLEGFGVPASSIWTEERSRSTHENAAFGAEILKQQGIQRIGLVVDATSMLRAAACFRKQGIAVEPFPSSFRLWGSLSEELLPSWTAIRRNEESLHETLGLGWYWLHGWI